MEKLAHPNDSMFERNISIIASRRNEVAVYSGGFVYEGFLCGLDDRWVQVYGHEENEQDKDRQWRFILLGKDGLTAIVPTGRSLNDVDEDIRDYVSKKIKNFSDVCEKFLVKGNSNERKESR